MRPVFFLARQPISASAPEPFRSTVNGSRPGRSPSLLRYSASLVWTMRPHRESLTLVPDEFYILMTKEAIGVPASYAAEMLPYDTRAGEFRVHYAGFFDPGFGWSEETKRAGGSRGVLEVRSHEVPFLLEHAQTVGWLQYERMAEPPETLYGRDAHSNYQGQTLRLAKQFRQA